MFGERDEGAKMKIRKTLCGVGRNEIEDNIDDLAKIVSKARYICTRCARASKKKKYLCKPMKLESKGK